MNNGMRDNKTKDSDSKSYNGNTSQNYFVKNSELDRGDGYSLNGDGKSDSNKSKDKKVKANARSLLYKFHNFDGRKEMKWSLIRMIEFILGLAAVILMLCLLLSSLKVKLTFPTLMLIGGVTVAVASVLFFELVVWSYGRPMFWNLWLMFSMAFSLFCFVCLGTLLASSQVKEAHVLILELIFGLAGVVFLLDTVLLLQYLLVTKVADACQSSTDGQTQIPLYTSDMIRPYTLDEECEAFGQVLDDFDSSDEYPDKLSSSKRLADPNHSKTVQIYEGSNANAVHPDQISGDSFNNKVNAVHPLEIFHPQRQSGFDEDMLPPQSDFNMAFKNESRGGEELRSNSRERSNRASEGFGNDRPQSSGSATSQVYKADRTSSNERKIREEVPVQNSSRMIRSQTRNATPSTSKTNFDTRSTKKSLTFLPGHDSEELEEREINSRMQLKSSKSFIKEDKSEHLGNRRLLDPFSQHPKSAPSSTSLREVATTPTRPCTCPTAAQPHYMYQTQQQVPASMYHQFYQNQCTCGRTHYNSQTTVCGTVVGTCDNCPLCHKTQSAAICPQQNKCVSPKPSSPVSSKASTSNFQIELKDEPSMKQTTFISQQRISRPVTPLPRQINERKPVVALPEHRKPLPPICPKKLAPCAPVPQKTYDVACSDQIFVLDVTTSISHHSNKASVKSDLGPSRSEILNQELHGPDCNCCVCVEQRYAQAKRKCLCDNTPEQSPRVDEYPDNYYINEILSSISEGNEDTDGSSRTSSSAGAAKTICKNKSGWVSPCCSQILKNSYSGVAQTSETRMLNADDIQELFRIVSGDQ